jgi:hypothetical protein
MTQNTATHYDLGRLDTEKALLIPSVSETEVFSASSARTSLSASSLESYNDAEKGSFRLGFESDEDIYGQVPLKKKSIMDRDNLINSQVILLNTVSTIVIVFMNKRFVPACSILLSIARSYNINK